MPATSFKSAPRLSLSVLLVCGWGFVHASTNSASSPQTPAGANANTLAQVDDSVSFDNIEIVDESLKKKISVLRVGSQMGENKLLTVFAGFKNKTSHKLAIEVETIYLDKSGNGLNAGSWFSLNLKAHEEREYHSASISELAVDFLVRVRLTPKVSNATVN